MASKVHSRSPGTEASASGNNSTVLEKIEGELAMCTICANRMTTKNSPRILTCLHSFCTTCLSTMARDGGITCPICRSVTVLTQQGVKSLSKNFTLVRMLELLEIKETKRFECDDCDEDTGGAIHQCIECNKFLCHECTIFHRRRRDTKTHRLVTTHEFQENASLLHQPMEHMHLWCTKHKGEQLRLFCNTCQVLICRDCTMIDHFRPEHNYIFVHEADSQHRDALVTALGETQERVPRAQELIEATDELIKEVNLRATDVEAEVRACLQQQRYQLLKKEEQLVGEIRSMKASKEKLLAAHKEALELFLGNVQSSCDFTRRILNQGTVAEMLATKVQILKQLNALAVKELTEKLPVDSSLHFFANTQALSEIIETFASVTVSSSFPPLCQAVGKGLQTACVGQESSFTVITFDTQGEKRFKGGDIISVKVEHPPQADDTASWGAASMSSYDDMMALHVEDNQNGSYAISFTPTIPHHHALLHVLIQSAPISNSPFSLTIERMEPSEDIGISAASPSASVLDE